MPHKKYPKGEVALERALSKLGLASRSQAQILIREGRVQVNGRKVTNPLASVHPERVQIEIDQQTQKPLSKVVYLFHKPRGVITTTFDPAGRPTVFDPLKGVEERLHAVGRLDEATSGLLLLTNDTALSAYLTDPASGIVRTYLVTVRGEVLPETLNTWTKGIRVQGTQLQAKSVRIQKSSRRETHLEMKLTEGKNREVRKLCKSAGHDVMRLRRIAYGDLTLGDLEPGAYRQLTAQEIFQAFPNLPERTRQRILQ